MNFGTDTSHSDFTRVQEEYKTNWYHFRIYNGLRLLQMILGIVGNRLTLKIICNLKVVENGHILMTYLCVSNIMVNCLMPFETYTSLMGTLGNENWKTLCIWQDYAYLIGNGFSVLSYFFMSVDR